MTADRRLATLTLFASVLFHVIMAASGALFPWRLEAPVKPSSRRYVVRLRQPASTPPAAPVPPVPPSPEATPRSLPIAPPEMEPLDAAPPPLTPTPVPDVVSTSVPSRQKVERMVPKKPRTAKSTPAIPARPKQPAKRNIPRQSVPARLQKRPKSQQSQPLVAQPPPPLAPPRQPAMPASPAPTLPQNETPLTPQPAAEPPGEDPLMTYLAGVSQALEREKRYPRVARRRAISGRVTLQFVILPDGRVMDAKITQSSGHAVLNTATLQALKRASPMPPFPPSIKKRQLQVEVTIAYELTP